MLPRPVRVRTLGCPADTVAPVRDRAAPMSMFDYDARPVTPLPVLVGTTASRGAYAIRDFLSRNGYPFEWVDAGQPDAVRAVLGVAEVEPSALPDAAVSSEFTELASDERMAKAAAALERNGIRPLLAATGADARGLVDSILADGAEVYNNTSRTLEAIGVADDIERSGRYRPLRLRLYRMDREMQHREMRTLAASPDYVVGSVHALTEGGSLLIASASGSQLGPLASGGR